MTTREQYASANPKSNSALPCYSDQNGRIQFGGLVNGASYSVSTSFDMKSGTVDFVGGRDSDMGNVVFDINAGYRIDNSIAVRKMMESDRTPDPLAKGTWVNGDELSLADCMGKLVVLHFWSSKDPESQLYFPLLQLLHEQHPDDCVVISVHAFIEDAEKSVRETIAHHKLGYRIMIDNASQETFKQYGGRLRPHVRVIDRDGRLNGDLSRAALLNKIFSNLTGKSAMPATN